MPRVPLILSCAIALCLGGCDRPSDTAAQPQEAAAAESPATLSGKVETGFAGSEMPVATVIDPDGETLDLASLKGKPVLLNLWATWCAPCVEEMPLLDRLAAETEGRMAVVTVSEDLNGAEAVRPFFARHGFSNLPQWIDTDMKLATAFGGGTGLPLTVLYDAEGKEVWRVVGGYDWSGAEARRRFAEAGVL